jgi:thioesterase domain-containing protein
MSADRITEAVDISPEACEVTALRFEECAETPGESLARFVLDDAAAQIRALRSALTASAQRVTELEAQLKAARYSDELVEPDDGDGSPYCECAALHSEGTEEMSSGVCSACGGII